MLAGRSGLLSCSSRSRLSFAAYRAPGPGGFAVRQASVLTEPQPSLLTHQ